MYIYIYIHSVETGKRARASACMYQRWKTCVESDMLTHSWNRVRGPTMPDLTCAEREREREREREKHSMEQ